MPKGRYTLPRTIYVYIDRERLLNRVAGQQNTDQIIISELYLQVKMRRYKTTNNTPISKRQSENGRVVQLSTLMFIFTMNEH